jgi:hypothetical protein
MNTPEILRRITAAGVKLAARDGHIIAKPRAAVTPGIIELIRAHKQELLAAIQSPLIARAIEILRERPGDVRAVVGKPQPNGRCLVAVAIRTSDGSIETCLLDARIDPFVLLELVERHGATIH